MKKILVMIIVGIFLVTQVAFAAPKKVSKTTHSQKKAATLLHSAALIRHTPHRSMPRRAIAKRAAKPTTKPSAKPTAAKH